MKVFVVEGKNDIKVVKSAFPESICIKTNGLGITDTTIQQIKNLASENEIIVITDPDSAGTKIRNIILKEIETATFVNLPKEPCVKKHKVGLENLSKAEFLKILNSSKTLNKTISNSYKFTLFDLVELRITGPNSKANRRKILNFLGVYHFNVKQLLFFLNNSAYSKTQLKEVLYA